MSVPKAKGTKSPSIKELDLTSTIDRFGNEAVDSFYVMIRFMS